MQEQLNFFWIRLTLEFVSTLKKNRSDEGHFNQWIWSLVPKHPTLQEKWELGRAVKVSPVRDGDGP